MDSPAATPSVQSLDSELRSPLPTLPHHLEPGLRLVFIGCNPGIESARAGRYYARPGNVFWKQLSESGLVGRTVGPHDDVLLMGEAGIGFTDLCRRPTLRAEHLTREELVAGAANLLAELVEFAPRVAVFSGKGVYQAFARHALGFPAAALARVPYGPLTQYAPSVPSPESRIQSQLWVIPSSSGLASKWHSQRFELLRELEAWLRSGGPDGQ